MHTVRALCIGFFKKISTLNVKIKTKIFSTTTVLGEFYLATEVAKFPEGMDGIGLQLEAYVT